MSSKLLVFITVTLQEVAVCAWVDQTALSACVFLFIITHTPDSELLHMWAAFEWKPNGEACSGGVHADPALAALPAKAIDPWPPVFYFRHSAWSPLQTGGLKAFSDWDPNFKSAKKKVAPILKTFKSAMKRQNQHEKSVLRQNRKWRGRKTFREQNESACKQLYASILSPFLLHAFPFVLICHEFHTPVTALLPHVLVSPFDFTSLISPFLWSCFHALDQYNQRRKPRPPQLKIN